MQFTTPPDPDTIATLAERALNAIPARLRDHITNLAIAVEEEADDDTLAEMGFETPWELTGLYRGTPLGEEDLYRLVRNVVIHEVAHHFGFTDAEIAALEAEIGD